MTQPLFSGRPITIHPVTPERWADLEALFRSDPVCRSCWCMWWRLKRSEFTRNGAVGNCSAMRAIVQRGEVPGLLAYLESDPIGWVSVGRREVFPVLTRSAYLKPVDEMPVWSVVCFAIAKPYRRRGLSALLLRAAVEYATSQGAKGIEGYPVRLIKGEKDFSAFTGAASTFAAAGFQEIAYRGGRRAIWRLIIE